MLDAGTMPTFNSGYGFVTYEGAGINDGYVPFGHPFDTVTFKTVLSRWVDTLVNKGWPLSRIGLISSPYTTSSQYPNIASYNKATGENITQEQLIEGNDKFKEGTTTKEYRDWETDRKSTRLNSSHSGESRMPSSA